MRIDVNIGEANSLAIRFQSEDLDAELALKELQIKCEKLHRIDDARLAAIGILLCRDVIGNNITFSGIDVPAHLAGSFAASNNVTESFVHPVSNRASALLPKAGDVTQQWLLLKTGMAASTEAKTVVVYRAAYGFDISLNEHRFPIITNLPLFTSFLSHSHEAIERAVMACLLYDLLGARNIAGLTLSSGNEWIVEVLRAVGFSFSGEQ